MKAIENLDESAEQSLGRSISSVGSSKSIFTSSSIVNSLNARIDSGEQALDYVIQDVCVNANDNVIGGDPANCATHRNVRIGEKVPYIVTDVDTRNGNATYQGLFSYPVPGTDGTLKILVSKNMQGQFKSNFNYDYDEHLDGFDLLDANGPYISGIRTSDPGCFDQIISSPSGRQNGWIFFAPGGGSGSVNHDIRIERITPSRPAECSSVSQSSGNSTQDIWNPPGPMTFESGKTLHAIQTYHLAHWNLSQQNNAIEKYYFTREYGFTRWEAWIPRNRCYAEGKWYCNDPSAYIGGRCAGSGTTTWGNQVWVRVDCRDSTNYISLNTPVLPLKNTMANGDIDTNLVLNLTLAAPIVAQPKTVCNITQSVCPNYPSVTGSFFDDWGGSASNQAVCMQRAGEYYSWCGISPSSGKTTTATYISSGQVLETKSVGATACQITQSVCPNYPSVTGSFFDDWGGSASNQAVCMRRASEYYSWCGISPDSGKTTTATYFSNGKTLETKTIGEVVARSPASTAVPLGSWNGNGAGSLHIMGNANGTGWEVPANTGYNFLTYGPYVQNLPAGKLKAVITLKVDNNSADNNPLIDIDVYRHSTNTVFAAMTITRRQFNNAHALQQFELPFDYDGGGALEFRVVVRGYSYVHHAGTSVWKN